MPSPSPAQNLTLLMQPGKFKGLAMFIDYSKSVQPGFAEFRLLSMPIAVAVSKKEDVLVANRRDIAKVRSLFVGRVTAHS